MIKASGETAASLVAILACIGRRRMGRSFTDWLNRSTCGMTTDASLGLNCGFLVVNRVGFLEAPRRCVAGIAFPAICIHRGMHRIRWMALGKIDRIVV